MYEPSFYLHRPILPYYIQHTGLICVTSTQYTREKLFSVFPLQFSTCRTTKKLKTNESSCDCEKVGMCEIKALSDDGNDDDDERLRFIYFT